MCGAFSPMFDLKKPTILLNSHIDTVKPVNGWRKDPFTPREENGKLYGLGSNDAGASVVSLLQVFLQLCRTSQKYNLILSHFVKKKFRARMALRVYYRGSLLFRSP